MYSITAHQDNPEITVLYCENLKMKNFRQAVALFADKTKAIEVAAMLNMYSRPIHGCVFL